MVSISGFRGKENCSNGGLAQELNFTVGKNGGVEILGGYLPLSLLLALHEKPEAISNNEANTSADRNPPPPSV